jgi:hypothetical protein
MELNKSSCATINDLREILLNILSYNNIYNKNLLLLENQLSQAPNFLTSLENLVNVLLSNFNNQDVSQGLQHYMVFLKTIWIINLRSKVRNCMIFM